MEAVVNWYKNKDISGNINFFQRKHKDPVEITVKLSGLKDGFHGFHIHEKKVECFDETTEKCCEKLGGHFNVGDSWSLENQNGTKHGPNGHNGDLCNNIYVENGLAEKYFVSNKISLFEEDKEYIVGRSIIIHEDFDDLGLIDYDDEEKNISKYITGNAGKRIACGNIEKLN